MTLLLVILLLALGSGTHMLLDETGVNSDTFDSPYFFMAWGALLAIGFLLSAARPGLLRSLTYALALTLPLLVGTLLQGTLYPSDVDEAALWPLGIFINTFQGLTILLVAFLGTSISLLIRAGTRSKRTVPLEA